MAPERFLLPENVNRSLFMRVITAALIKLTAITSSPEKTVCNHVLAWCLALNQWRASSKPQKTVELDDSVEVRSKLLLSELGILGGYLY